MEDALMEDPAVKSEFVEDEISGESDRQITVDASSDDNEESSDDVGITNDEEISDDFVLVPTDKEPQSDDVKFWKETLSGKSVEKAHQLLREHGIRTVETAIKYYLDKGCKYFE